MITVDSVTGDKFFAGINDTGEQLSLKKIEMTPMAYSEARGTLIYEKNLKSKISCQTN
jgi:hypothetical protein